MATTTKFQTVAAAKAELLDYIDALVERVEKLEQANAKLQEDIKQITKNEAANADINASLARITDNLVDRVVDLEGAVFDEEPEDGEDEEPKAEETKTDKPKAENKEPEKSTQDEAPFNLEKLDGKTPTRTPVGFMQVSAFGGFDNPFGFTQRYVIVKRG